MQVRVAEKIGSCGCGRSPTGDCCGWHALSQEAYKAAKDQYDLTEYKKQAQELWSDSCTTPRKGEE
jgi:hypothetical protein